MTNAEFKTLINRDGDKVMKETCYKLRVDIVKKIVNCKAIDTANQDVLLRNYMSNGTTNNAVIEAIKQFIYR